VVVTHVAIMRVMLLYSQGMDLNEYKKVPVPENGEVFVIRY
jgi:broad specificity phosphatase PhoE